MDFQVVEVNKEDKIVIVTSKMEYTFTPERYDVGVTNFTKDILLKIWHKSVKDTRASPRF